MIWSGYYYKLLDSWTPPLYYTPRWFQANAYPQLTDDIELPATTSFGAGSNFVTPTSSLVPPQWVLTSATPASGQIMQRFWETFVHEKEYIFPNLTSIYLNRTFYFDESDPQHAWLAGSAKLVNTLQIGVSGNTLLTIPKADNMLELFMSGEWKWFQEGSVIILYGLDLQEQKTETRIDNWHFVSNKTTWSSGSITFLEHPSTKNWIPIHPQNVREDGFLNFNCSGTLRYRSPVVSAAQSLSAVIVYLDGNPVTAKLVTLYNSLDEKGLWVKVGRRQKELNSDYAKAILQASWFGRQTFSGVRDFLSAALRTGSIVTVSAASSGYTLPTGSTGYSVRNINRVGYATEYLTPDSNTRDQYRSIFASPDFGFGFLRNQSTEYTTTASGTIEFLTDTDNHIDQPWISWKIPYWDDSETEIAFTENMPQNVPDLLVFVASGVDVVEPSRDTLKRAFDKTSPVFRWQSSIIQTNFIEPIKGLAQFDY